MTTDGHRRGVLKGPVRAVIFDMDGVIADSEPVFAAAIDAVVAPEGKVLTPEVHARIMGHGVAETWEILVDAMGLNGSPGDYLAAYDAELRQRLAEVREALPGVRDLIARLQSEGMPFAVASSSQTAWIDALLGGLGLREAFAVTASATEVEHSKPAPDVYLLAASRLGIDPRECLAIEDTPAGIRSAKAAGMFAVQVRSSSTAFPPLPEADLVLASLLDFPF